LKSTMRYRRFAPPPLCHIVIRPVLFRPPVFVKPSVRALTGRPFQSSERSISTSPRWPGVVGLYDFNARVSVFRLLSDHLRSEVKGSVDPRVNFRRRHSPVIRKWQAYHGLSEKSRGPGSNLGPRDSLLSYQRPVETS